MKNTSRKEFFYLLGDCVANRETYINVILSVSEESRISSTYEAEILRPSPQDDTGTWSCCEVK